MAALVQADGQRVQLAVLESELMALRGHPNVLYGYHTLSLMPIRPTPRPEAGDRGPTPHVRWVLCGCLPPRGCRHPGTQAGAQGGGCGLINQGNFFNGKCITRLKEPASVSAIALHWSREHKPFDVEVLGKPLPYLSQQLLPCPASAGVFRGVLWSDQTFEIPVKFWVIGVIQPCFDHLTANQRLVTVVPDEAGHFSWAVANGGELH